MATTCNGLACATALSTSAAAALATASMVIGSSGYSNAWNGCTLTDLFSYVKRHILKVIYFTTC